jgi:hypothetical protein
MAVFRLNTILKRRRPRKYISPSSFRNSDHVFVWFGQEMVYRSFGLTLEGMGYVEKKFGIKHYIDGESFSLNYQLPYRVSGTVLDSYLTDYTIVYMRRRPRKMQTKVFVQHLIEQEGYTFA